MEIKVSIIIPVYNVKPFMEKSFSSIMNQTYKNIEIIVVDDGSTDGSGEICENLPRWILEYGFIIKRMVICLWLRIMDCATL